MHDVRQGLGAAVGAVAEKVSEAGSALTEIASDAGGFISEKAEDGRELISQAQWEARMRRYRPVFPEQYRSSEFDLPMVIVVVDGDSRKGIDVCEGAVGWMSSQNGMEILHLYEAFIGECGLDFYPVHTVNGVYYADPFDARRFVDLSCLFDVAQQDRITELRNIARDLGAKYCKLESCESKKEVTVKDARGSAKGRKGKEAQASLEAAASQSDNKFSELSLVFEQTFSGTDAPRKRPQLNWFRHDREIQSLVETMCSEGSNQFSTYTIEINGATSATLAYQQAAKIDGVLKRLHASCNFTMEGECMAEARRKLRFTIEF